MTEDSPVYAELHAHSNFSFLDGAAHPSDLVAEAARLGLSGLALTDHDGLYGVVRFAEAARALGVATIFGAELTLGATRRANGLADPEGNHLVVLARDPEGYARLARAIALAQLAGGAKGRPRTTLAELAEAHGGHWLVLTGCRKGTVPAALVGEGPSAASRRLEELVAAFGRANVAVELFSHDTPLDSARNDALAELALRRGVAYVATTNAHYATPAGHRLHQLLAAVRARRSLEELAPYLPPGPAAHLRSGTEQLRRFARYPGAVECAGELGAACAFDLRLLAPGLPPFAVPAGETEMSHLRTLVANGARERYGPPESARVAGAYAQLDHELAVIEELGFAGYFLVVYDIVAFCRRNDIYCQGRGSAANSAVCYALRITNVDAVSLKLFFERFLSAARDGPPDIDVDIESGRREEVIQYVYERHGRHNAAQVANLISYRPRSALRDAAKALGVASGTVDSWARALTAHASFSTLAAAKTRRAPTTLLHQVPEDVLGFALALEDFPRHLGVHSGGMVICDRPVIEVCPVEWASAPGRTVLQWDKEDCAAIGLVKFDLLGLGMLEALHRCIDLVASAEGVQLDLATLPQEDAVYEAMSRADTIGVFQIESRAQMGTLPRLRPRTFEDLVVEVALIRPGPIQGGSVHPYLRRRNGEEPVAYPHPLLEACLKKTLGVPLFQEQLMQMAIDVAGFTAFEADQLRVAMGAKRSRARMEALRERFFAGMAERGITGALAEEIFSKMAAFSSFGFPESHAVSFAYLVYASGYLKLHHPAAFLASLLNSQPMGFWAPRTLVADARRHGVEVRRADVNASGALAGLEDSADGPAVRLGLATIAEMSTASAERLVAGQPYRDLEDLARRGGCTRPQLEALALAGATAGLTQHGRRGALWSLGALAGARPDQLEGTTPGAEAPVLQEMTAEELVVADLRTTGVATEGSLTALRRDALAALGVTPADGLRALANASRVVVAGVVTHRQRPETARGITFVNLEDETGLVNVICSIGVWQRYEAVATAAAAMVVRGRLESAYGVVNVIAEQISELVLATRVPARDFR